MLTVVLVAAVLSGGDVLLVAEPELSMDDATLAATFAPAGRVVRVMRVTATSSQERAAARAAVDAARALCRDGRALALQVMTDAAITTLRGATARFAEGATAREDFVAMAACFVELGAALCAADRDGAAEAFARALALDPAAAPDTRRHNPVVVARFQSVRAELAKQAPAALEVATRPPLAEAALDGLELGGAPLSRGGLTPGTHVLSVSAPGHRRFVEEIHLGAAASTRREVRLSPIDEPFAALPRDDDAVVRLSALAEKHGVEEVIVLDASAMGARAWSVEHGASPLIRGGDVASLAPGVRAFLEASAKPALSPFIAALPLGIGHFAQDRPLAGAIFLVTELGLIAANLLTARAVLDDRRDDGRFNDPDRDRRLQLLNLTAFGLLLAEMTGEAWHGVAGVR